MRYRATALAVLLALSVGSFGPAHAQQMCGPTEGLMVMLTSQYGETVQDRGMTASGIYVAWWGNSETGSWTVTASRPDGVSCIIVSGMDFEHAATSPAPMGEQH